MPANTPATDTVPQMTSRRPRVVPLLFLVAGLVLLLGALVIEHGMGIAPCVLCLYQRIPPAVALPLAALALWPRVPAAWARRLTAMVALVFLAGAVLAGYHVGVEQHWWAGTAQCGGDAAPPPDLSTDLSALRRALEAPEVVPCDAIPWSFVGISLAGYNMIVSMGLAVLGLWAAGRRALWRES